jgi:hypothetical protein
MYRILRNKFVQKQIQISRYQKLLDATETISEYWSAS